MEAKAKRPATAEQDRVSQLALPPVVRLHLRFLRCWKWHLGDA